MADNNIPPYPLMFSPDQWANKFSPFQGQPIPFPTQYRGTPTDALGRPIQSYLDTQAQHDAWAAANPAPQSMAPSTTLNSTPQSAYNQRLASMGVTGGAQDPAMQARINPGPSAYYAQGSSGSLGGNQYDSARIPMTPFAQAQPGTPQQRAPAPAAPTNPFDMNQAYLDALSNPGRVRTPGATVPQSPTPSNQSGVLQQFLANWKGGGGQTQGAGNYNNAGFFNALQGQV